MTMMQIAGIDVDKNRMKRPRQRKPSHSHTMTIVVRFDRPCSREHAIRETRDCIHGEFYPTQRSDRDPGSFRVKTIKR